MGYRRMLRQAAQIDAMWFHPNRQAAYDFADELAGWPEPIDLIRSALGVRPRARVYLAAARQALTPQPRSSVFEGALSGNPPPTRPKKGHIRWVNGKPVVEIY